MRRGGGGGRDDSAAARSELRRLRGSNLFRLDMAAECASPALASVNTRMADGKAGRPLQRAAARRCRQGWKRDESFEKSISERNLKPIWSLRQPDGDRHMTLSLADFQLNLGGVTAAGGARRRVGSPPPPSPKVTATSESRGRTSSGRRAKSAVIEIFTRRHLQSPKRRVAARRRADEPAGSEANLSNLVRNRITGKINCDSFAHRRSGRAAVPRRYESRGVEAELEPAPELRTPRGREGGL